MSKKFLNAQVRDEPRNLYFNQHKLFETYWSKKAFKGVSNSRILLSRILCPVSGSVVSSCQLIASTGSHHSQSQFWSDTPPLGEGAPINWSNGKAWGFNNWLF